MLVMACCGCLDFVDDVASFLPLVVVVAEGRRKDDLKVG